MRSEYELIIRGYFTVSDRSMLPSSAYEVDVRKRKERTQALA